MQPQDPTPPDAQRQDDALAQLLALTQGHEARRRTPWHPRACEVCAQEIVRPASQAGRHATKHRRCGLLWARLAQVERASDAVGWSPQGADHAARLLLEIARKAAQIPVEPAPQQIHDATTRLPARPTQRPIPSEQGPRCRACLAPLPARKGPSRRPSVCSLACQAWVHRAAEAAALLPAAWGSPDALHTLAQRLLTLAQKIQALAQPEKTRPQED
jgi:hypothetical protein